MRRLLSRYALWRADRLFVLAAACFGERRKFYARKAQAWRRWELWLSGLPSDDMEVAG